MNIFSLRHYRDIETFDVEENVEKISRGRL